MRGTKCLGVAWYLHPDAGPAGDGKHTAYLLHPSKWRHLDADLFDVLRGLIPGRRSVANIQQSGILGDAVFAADVLAVADVKVRDRERWRHQWFDRIHHHLAACDLVFADPDNGLVPDDRFTPTNRRSAKGMPVAEARALSEGRAAVIYHHNSRRRGGHLEEIRWLKTQLPEGTMAYYWRRVSNRTFFIINADEEIRRRVHAFVHRWGDRGVLV